MTFRIVEKRLGELEETLFQLKTEFYRSRPRRVRPMSRYAEAALLRTARQVRDNIWSTRYAKRAKSVS